MDLFPAMDYWSWLPLKLNKTRQTMADMKRYEPKNDRMYPRINPAFPPNRTLAQYSRKVVHFLLHQVCSSLTSCSVNFLTYSSLLHIWRVLLWSTESFPFVRLHFSRKKVEWLQFTKSRWKNHNKETNFGRKTKVESFEKKERIKIIEKDL